MKTTFTKLMTAIVAGMLISNTTAIIASAAEANIFDRKAAEKEVFEMLEKSSTKAPSKYIAFVNENSRYNSGTVQLSINYDSSIFYGSNAYSCFSLYPVLSTVNIGGTTWKQASTTITWNASNNGVYADSTMAIEAITLDVVSGYEVSVLVAEITNPSQYRNNPQVSYAKINGNVISSSNYGNYISIGYRALGDVNGDHYLSSADVALISAEIGSLTPTLTAEQLAAADYNQDGRVTISDTIALNSFLSS